MIWAVRSSVGCRPLNSCCRWAARAAAAASRGATPKAQKLSGERLHLRSNLSPCSQVGFMTPAPQQKLLNPNF